MTRFIHSAVLAIAVLICGTSSLRAQTASEAPGFRPTLSVQTWDGQTFDLSAHRGSWVVVNFWATWCAPCLKEMPDFSAFDQARDDVQVIGLAYEEIDANDMRAFLAKHPVSYPVSIVDLLHPPEDFEPPRGLPLTYLVAPDGRIAKRFMGPITSEMLAKTIASIGEIGRASCRERVCQSV